MTQSPIAYSYIRFSTPAQRKGDSLRRQLEASEEYALEHGLTLNTEYRDLGLSGFKGIHRIKGALGEFLRRVKSGEIERGSFLIVENLDRLSREDVLTAVSLFIQIIEAGITVVTLTDEISYSRESIIRNPNELQISIGTFARANQESRLKAKRLTRTWEHKRSIIGDTKLTSVVPFWLQLLGATAEERLNADWTILNGSNGTANRVALVQRIFQMCIDGIGKENIARTLNEERVPSPKGRDGWHASTVHLLLKDRRVLGELQLYTKAGGQKRRAVGEPLAGYFPQIVEPSTFYRAQKAIQSRRCGGGGRKGKFANLFVGLTRCECGSAMEYRDKGIGKGRHLVCARHHRKQNCANGYRFTYRSLETMILAFVSDVSIRDTDAQKATVARLKLAGKIAERDDVKARIGRVRRDLEAEDDTDEVAALKERRLALRAMLGPLETEIAALSLEANQGKRSHLDDRRAALKRLWASIEGLSGPDLFAARAAISASLKEVINWISFERDGEVIAVLASGFKAYRFRDGAFLGCRDQSDLAHPGRSSIEPSLAMWNSHKIARPKAVVASR